MRACAGGHGDGGGEDGERRRRRRAHGSLDNACNGVAFSRYLPERETGMVPVSHEYRVVSA